MTIFTDTQHHLTNGFTLGGKAANLFRLCKMGFTVPPFAVIPAETLTALLPSDLLSASAQQITEYIEKLTLPTEITNRVGTHFTNDTLLAVRSSGADEDGSDFSFAGQFESYLFVKKSDLALYIKKVWQSAFSERVFEYRKNNRLGNLSSIAIVVQAMIDAQVAGVAFGVNPTNGDRDAVLISALYGLGEGLVSGELDADNFVVKNNTIERQIANKTHQFVFDQHQGHGTTKTAVNAEKQHVACLADEQILTLANMLKRCTQQLARPQDVEFAIHNNTIYLLQTRPITNLNKMPDHRDQYIVWDNSNIVESYPGLTLPLTFSFIIRMYDAAYRQFMLLMGLKNKEIEQNSGVFANMLGLLGGRVYYNLLSWYKALAMLPGYSLNAGFMEKMMGVKERFELTDQPQHTRLQERLRVVQMIGSMLKNLFRLPKMRRTFVHDFNQTMHEYEKINLSKQTAHQLMHLYERFEQTMLKKWKAPLVNDFFTMIYFGTLQKLIVKYKISDSPQLANDLLCAARDIISAQPARLCMQIAQQINDDADAKKLFLENDEHQIWQTLQKGACADVYSSISAYIAKFGDRCVGELKLENTTYKQAPWLFVKIMKSYIVQDIVQKTEHSDFETRLRQNAEAQVKKALQWKPFKRAIFGYVLRQTRVLVSGRENLRFERTRGFGMVRQMFNAIGDVFTFEGVIAQRADIFYLTKEEIFDYIKGTSANRDLRQLIDNRKKDYEVFEKMPMSERIKTYGIVYHGNNFYQEQTSTEQLTGDLRGLACCPGRVRAKVQVITNPNEVNGLNGDILVTANTDPGWVTLFPTASGIITERGSLLSHSAIVSREMGKPCIVAVSGLLSRLRTGDLIEMDGSTGEIKIISAE